MKNNFFINKHGHIARAVFDHRFDRVTVEIDGNRQYEDMRIKDFWHWIDDHGYVTKVD